MSDQPPLIPMNPFLRTAHEHLTAQFERATRITEYMLGEAPVVPVPDAPCLPGCRCRSCPPWKV